MMRRRHDVGRQRPAEESADRLPTVALRVTGYKVAKALRILTGDLRHNAAVVGGIHIFDVRREQFEGEVTPKAHYLARIQAVETHRMPCQRPRARRAPLFMLLDGGENITSA